MLYTAYFFRDMEGERKEIYMGKIASVIDYFLN
jgi:hypothetical protein